MSLLSSKPCPSEIDSNVDILKETVSNLKKFIEKTRSDTRMMVGQIESEKWKALSALSKSHSILAEMEILIVKSESFLETEGDRCKKILERNRDSKDVGINYNKHSEMGNQTNLEPIKINGTSQKSPDKHKEDNLAEKCFLEMQQVLYDKDKLPNPQPQTEIPNIKETKNESTQTDIFCSCLMAKVSKSPATRMTVAVERSSGSPPKPKILVPVRIKIKNIPDLSMDSKDSEKYSLQVPDKSEDIINSSSSKTDKNTDPLNIQNGATHKLDDNNNSNVTAKDKSASEDSLLNVILDDGNNTNVISEHKGVSEGTLVNVKLDDVNSSNVTSKDKIAYEGSLINAKLDYDNNTEVISEGKCASEGTLINVKLDNVNSSNITYKDTIAYEGSLINAKLDYDINTEVISEGKSASEGSLINVKLDDGNNNNAITEYKSASEGPLINVKLDDGNNTNVITEDKSASVLSFLVNVKLDDADNSDVTSKDKSAFESPLVNPEKSENKITTNSIDKSPNFAKKYKHLLLVKRHKITCTTPIDSNQNKSSTEHCISPKSAQKILYIQSKPISSLFKFSTAVNLLKETNSVFNFGLDDREYSVKFKQVNEKFINKQTEEKTKHYSSKKHATILNCNYKNAASNKSVGSLGPKIFEIDSNNKINFVPKDPRKFSKTIPIENRKFVAARRICGNAMSYKKVDRYTTRFISFEADK